jgi:hypothetical protein
MLQAVKRYRCIPPLGNRDAELIDGLHEGARVRRSPKEVLPIPCRDD